MKETRFIAQNEKKWEQFESQLQNKNRDSDELRNMFIQVTDDLSYARTFYPNRSVKVYLNNLSQQFFTHIYKNPTSIWQAFKNFWIDDIPQICYNERRTILVSFLVLVIAIVIGVFSTIKDPSFTTHIMGNEYVQMTKDNIAKGKPFNVYADENQLDMFFAIGWNNLFACFRTFIFGLLFGIGSLGMLLYMGIEMGTFHTLFFQVSTKLLVSSLLTVWLHGTIEIGCLVLSAAAGLMLARGILFPATFSRWQSFQLAGRRAVKLMLAVFPLIIIAAFIESFITRYAQTPWFIKLLLIIASLVLMVGYFVWYPHRKAKKGFFSGIEDVHLPFQPVAVLSQPSGIQSNSDTLGNTFLYFSKLFSSIAKIGFVVISLITVWYMYAEILLKKINTEVYSNIEFERTNVGNVFGKLYDLFFFGEGVNFSFLFYAIALSVLMISITYFLRKKWQQSLPSFSKFLFQKIFLVLMNVVLFNSFLLIPSFLKMFLVLLVYPFLFLFCFIICFDEIRWQQSFGYAWKLFWESFLKTIAMNLIVAALIAALFLLFGNPATNSFLFSFYETIIRWNISSWNKSTDKIYEAIIFFTTLFIGYTSLAIWFLANALQYFNLKEIVEGNSLKSKVDNMGR